jgi:arylsulfatase A-like enzyme
VLNRLDELGLANDTVVIFTSDHGDYMGDHGLMLKLLLHYQGIIRVPFIWHDPSEPTGGQTDSGLASSIDIGPTMLARAGIQPFNGIQGRDLHSSQSPEAVIIEEDSQRLMTGFDRPQRVRTVVTDQYRMSLREGEDWNELYDLLDDPGETKNLYDDPQGIAARQKLTEVMLRRMIALQDRAPLPAYRA